MQQHEISMAEESDADLLQYVAWKNEYPAEATAAFALFHARHAEFVYAVCAKRFARQLPTYYTVEDLVSDTFVRVLERAETFDPNGERDPAAQVQRVRVWLLAIAFNVLNDVYRGHPTNEVSRDAEYFEQVTDVPAPEDSPRVRLAARAFVEALDEREQEVLRVTLYWNKPGVTHQRLPNDVSADLAKRLGTTTENIRKIRASALRKVRDFIQQAERSADDTVTHADAR
jgi:RNA polymerase sigma factor (sigma-70 family)